MTATAHEKVNAGHLKRNVSTPFEISPFRRLKIPQPRSSGG